MNNKINNILLILMTSSYITGATVKTKMNLYSLHWVQDLLIQLQVQKYYF